MTRARPWARGLALAAIVTLACVGCGDGGKTKPPLDVDYLERLETEAEYEALDGEGDEVKFLLRVDGRDAPVPAQCLFQNTERFAFHLEFLRASFEATKDLGVMDYSLLVLKRASRVWWGGALKHFPSVRHPSSGERGVYAVLVYDDINVGDLETADLEEVWARLADCAPLTDRKRAFVPVGEAQTRFATDHAAALDALDIAVLFPEQLVEREYEAYSEGENYGYLHVLPEGQAFREEDVGIEDIVVVKSAPPDTTLVAGLVSALPQTVYSHTNLRLREKDLPSVMVANVYERQDILALKDKLVRMVATDEGVTFEVATREDAEAFWESRRPDLGPLESDLARTEFTPLADLRHADAVAYGVKAANLGELNVALPAENTAQGFGIPFASYVAFMDAAGLADDVTDMLADPRMKTDRAFRVNRLASLRGAMRGAALPAGTLDAVDAAAVAAFGEGARTAFLRFRSSTNAEDLEAFSGAGLYDSRTGCLADDLDQDTAGPSKCLSAEHKAFLEARIASREAELEQHPGRTWLVDLIAEDREDLTEEKPAARALQRVWASLWNLRAFDERAYYGIEHDEAFMGVAVVPSFVMEEKEAVAVTNLDREEGSLYRVVSQLGDVGVVRPSIPTAVPEVLELVRVGDDLEGATVTVHSSLLPTAPLWPGEEQTELASLLFAAHDHFAANVYGDLAPLRLDIEIERTHDGRTVLKQARPYLGEDAP